MSTSNESVVYYADYAILLVDKELPKRAELHPRPRSSKTNIRLQYTPSLSTVNFRAESNRAKETESNKAKETEIK